MEDLTKYNDDELSLRVFNDEDLYNMRYNDIVDVCEELFIFTDEQRQILLDDLIFC